MLFSGRVLSIPASLARLVTRDSLQLRPRCAYRHQLHSNSPRTWTRLPKLKHTHACPRPVVDQLILVALGSSTHVTFSLRLANCPLYRSSPIHFGRSCRRRRRRPVQPPTVVLVLPLDSNKSRNKWRPLPLPTMVSFRPPSSRTRPPARSLGGNIRLTAILLCRVPVASTCCSRTTGQSGTRLRSPRPTPSLR